MPDRALVVLASNLLFGGYEAGTDPAQALQYATRAVLRALAFREPTVAVALIDAAPDFADYPASVRTQHGMLQRVLAEHGFGTVVVDDPVHVAASYVRAAVQSGHDAMVVATDKRLAQLVSDVVWWNDPYKRVRYTPELVRKRFEVAPDRVAGWLALVGDRETLPGVKGLGKKGATSLIEEHGSLAEAIERADEIEGRTGKALRASLEDAKRELGRATLETDRPLPMPLDQLPWRAPSKDDLNALYRSLGYHGLLQTEDATVDATVCATVEDVEALTPAAPTSVLAVTEDPSPARGDLAGLVLAWDGGAAWVPESLLDPLVPWLEDAERSKVGHATKSVQVALARRGITLRGVVGDSESQSHIHDPTGLAPHDLDDLARRVLHQAVPTVDSARGVGKRRRRWSKVKPEVVAATLAPWAEAARQLCERLTVEPERLAEYLELSDVLARMELQGIGCDADDLARSAADFQAMQDAVEAEIHALAGKEFNVGSTKQLGTVLFEELGLTILKRTKTGWSTATDALERIEHEHPIVPLVIRWRLARWLRTSWAVALAKAIDPDGRIHGTFHHARSFSGRVICSAPDLGRVPGRTAEMTRIRHAFCAAPGSVLLSVDYDQLGLYVLAHLSGDEELVGALTDAADLHRITASAVLGVPQDELSHEQRQMGKITNFATFAGQGASALALQLGVTAAEAKDIIARFFEHYSGVRDFQTGELEHAREHGYIVTLAGRKQYVSGFDSRDSALKSYADRVGRRATHEGSVADVTRAALLHSDRALRAAGLSGFPVHQLLDEVLFEVPEAELDATLAVTVAAFRDTFDLRVPLRVSAKVGARWGAMEPLAVPPRDD